MSKKQVSLECVCALLIILFLYASVSKFIDFTTFLHQMANQPWPTSWAPFVAWIVPTTEVLLALALIFERTRTLGLYGSLVLMSLFTIYTLIVLLHFFHYVPCSCGGVIRRLTWRQHLFFNLFFVVLSVFGINVSRHKPNIASLKPTNSLL
jgi:putative oxidoreductase